MHFLVQKVSCQRLGVLKIGDYVDAIIVLFCFVFLYIIENSALLYLLVKNVDINLI